jgi:hypothetical protein
MSANTVPLFDADPAWVDIEGDIRLRWNPVFGSLQIQVSSGNEDDGYEVSSILVPGAIVRDTRHSDTQWPDFTGNLPEPFVTTTDERNRTMLAGEARAEVVVGPNDVPVSSSSNKSGR